MDKPLYTLFLRGDQKPFLNTTRWVLIIIKLLLIPVIVILMVPYWWALAIILALATFFEYRVMKLVPTIDFTEEGVSFNSMTRKKFQWKTLDNVILKDDLLTIDFSDNRLFQKEVQSSADEQLFNDWCREKLSGLKG